MTSAHHVHEGAQLAVELGANGPESFERERDVASALRGYDWDSLRAARSLQRGAAQPALRVPSVQPQERGIPETKRVRRAALSEASIGTWRWNCRDRSCGGDAEFLAMYGLAATDEMLPADRVLRWIPQELRQQLEDALESGLASEQGLVRELHFTEGPLAGRCHRWKGRVSVAERGIGVGICHDITEEIRTLQALSHVEDSCRALVTASTGVVFRMSPDWSEMWQLIGRGQIADTVEPSETWLQRYIPAEEQARILCAIQNAIATKNTLELEHQVLRAHGSVGRAFSRAIPLLDESGGIIEWLGMASDITAAKTPEAELAEGLSALEQMLALCSKGLHAGERQPLLQDIIEAAVAILAADKGILQLFQHDRLVVVAQHGHELPFLDSCANAGQLPLSLGETLGRGERLLVVDVEREPLLAGTSHLQALREAGVASFQATPLLTRAGQALGVLTTHWSKPRSLDNKDRWRLDLLGRQSSELIEQANARAALCESEARLSQDLFAMQRLHELGMKSVRSNELPAVLEAVLDAAMAVSNADFGNIQLVADNAMELQIVAQRGFPQGWLDGWKQVPKGKWVCGRALELGTRVIVEDVELSPMFIGTRALELQRGVGVRAVQSTPMFGRAGEVLGVFSTHYKQPYRPDQRTLQFLDLLAHQAAEIIERAKAEEALRLSEERFRLVLEGSPATVCCQDLDLRYIWVYNPSPAFEVDAWAGKLMEEVWSPDDALLLRGIKQHVISSGKGRRDEVVLHVPKAKGGQLVYDLIVEPLRDGSGAITGVTSVGIDITERKHTQGLLRTKRFNECFIDSANVAIMAVDERGCTTLFNATAERITGYTRAELFSRSWFEVLVPRAKFADVWAELSLDPTNRIPDSFESPLLTKSGEVRTMSWRNSRIPDGSGATMTITFGIDLTEQRRTEQYLLHAQKMDSIGTLAGGIAHDFNNILNGIMGGLAFFEISQGATAERLAEVDDMKALVRRGADLCRQLLGFACRGKYLPKAVDLARSVEVTSHAFGRTQRDIMIVLELAEGLPAVLMDPSQLEQALLNLFLNAAQAMPAGGRLLVHAEAATATGERGAQPADFVKLVVADTGVGMAPAIKTRIFEPFFTTRPGEGSGLGLASVYGIVKNHGGAITVDSEPGKGTTFTLMLPVAHAPLPVPSVPRPAGTPRGNGQILVVDDEVHLLNLWARVLERLGYSVLVASGGRLAVELARANLDTLQLVLLDLVMPEMSGVETFDALREIAPELKVLLVSASAADSDVMELLNRGCNGFIEKPFDMATLASNLQRLI